MPHTDWGYIPMEWYASDGDQLTCPEADCQTGIKACDTEWQTADHYNWIHSSIRMEYRYPACQARLVSFTAASDHIANKRTDQGHIDHGVHVQAGLATW